jgi:cell division protease FtsH
VRDRALHSDADGFAPNVGVIVMAATNRPETLDQALLRPGRFDRHVLVDRPDIRGREAILKVHVKQVKLDPSIDLKEVASLTPGFVGADLANLVNEAALLAARSERASVGIKEFNEGIERVTAGLEKKQRVMNQDEKHRVAYHESGHALVAYSLPNTDPVHKVSIIPRGLAALGYTLQRPEGDRYLMTQSELESRIQVLLAGTIAEEMIYQDISTGAQNDLERATEFARSMVMEYGMSRLGRVNYRESNRSPFLAMSGGDERLRSHSEQTAREIDQEVKHFGLAPRCVAGPHGSLDGSGVGGRQRTETDHRRKLPRPPRRPRHRRREPARSGFLRVARFRRAGEGLTSAVAQPGAIRAASDPIRARHDGERD